MIQPNLTTTPTTRLPIAERPRHTTYLLPFILPHLREVSETPFHARPAERICVHTHQYLIKFCEANRHKLPVAGFTPITHSMVFDHLAPYFRSWPEFSGEELYPIPGDGPETHLPHAYQIVARDELLTYLVEEIARDLADYNEAIDTTLWSLAQ